MTRSLRTAPLVAALMLALSACSQQAAAPATAPAAPVTAAAPADAALPAVDDAEAARMAEQVREATRHAWQGYMQYAKGHDDLKPLSGQPRDWYPKPLLMSPVDALDTLLLLGLDKEANEARELIVTQLSFDQDIDVQNFEVTIRLLGGLLSAYQMTNDERLLKLADDLGTRLSPVFDSPTAPVARGEHGGRGRWRRCR